MARNQYSFRSWTLIALSFTFHAADAQMDGAFDGVGDETYTGVNGFGPFNWVNAINFGFTQQQGANAFLSNYTGLPIPDIGMIKPFTTLMENTTYRVSFHCSRYSSTYTLGLSDYDTLYIGSRYGTMVWDTVPTPQTDFDWVRWSGLYTPAPEDIGQPFRFGFSLTLNNLTSFALDGPIYATDVATGLTERLDAPDELIIAADPGGARIDVRTTRPMAEVEVFDARGARVASASSVGSMTWSVATTGHAASLYVVRVRLMDGALRTARVMMP